MSEIRVVPAQTDAELQRSLDVINAVHPREPVGLTEARDAERQARGFAVCERAADEPIRRLNEELGYRPIPGRIRLRGPLAPTG